MMIIKYTNDILLMGVLKRDISERRAETGKRKA
jgi:hypothetical protein